MAATYALFKVTQGRFPSLPVEVLVNSQRDPSSEDVFLMMSSAASRFMGFELRSAGAVPEDSLLRDLSREGRPLAELPITAPSLEATSLIHARLAAEQESAGTEGMHVLSASFSG
jgi:hypothetical protein